MENRFYTAKEASGLVEGICMKKLVLLGVLLFPGLVRAEDIPPDVLAELRKAYQQSADGASSILPEDIPPEVLAEMQKAYQNSDMPSGRMPTPEEAAEAARRFATMKRPEGPGQPDHREPITLPPLRDPWKKEREIMLCGMNIGYFAPGAYYICYGALGTLFTCLASPGTCWAPIAGASVACGLSYANIKGIIHNCM